MTKDTNLEFIIKERDMIEVCRVLALASSGHPQLAMAFESVARSRIYDGSNIATSERKKVLKEIDDAIYALKENGEDINYETVHMEIVHLFPLVEIP